MYSFDLKTTFPFIHSFIQIISAQQICWYMQFLSKQGMYYETHLFEVIIIFEQKARSLKCPSHWWNKDCVKTIVFDVVRRNKTLWFPYWWEVCIYQRGVRLYI